VSGAFVCTRPAPRTTLAQTSRIVSSRQARAPTDLQPPATRARGSRATTTKSGAVAAAPKSPIVV
jgi:hypothetical protein